MTSIWQRNTNTCHIAQHRVSTKTTTTHKYGGTTIYNYTSVFKWASHPVS